MGRFASTVEFYSRYREPYSAQFFAAVARQLAFRGDESLLDIGCGPGLLAIGFAPFVAHCTGLDPEPAMIEAATQAAAAAGVSLSLLPGRIEDFTASKPFDILTIGRALHWLDRDPALARMEQIASPNARLLVCSASSIESPATLWVRAYSQVRRAYVSDADEARYRIDGRSWFRESAFTHLADISVNQSRSFTIDDLIGRALSRSNTSPQVLGPRRKAFEHDIREALEPFAHHGVLQDEIIARASVFERSRAPRSPLHP